jgi:hypothetical protein
MKCLFVTRSVCHIYFLISLYICLISQALRIECRGRNSWSTGFFSANPVAGIKVFIKMLTEAERKRLAQIFFEFFFDRLEISLHLLQSREVIDLINCT